MRESIIATADDEKIIFTRHGNVMWTRVRIQNGEIVSTSRETTKNVEKEIELLDGWDIQRKEGRA